MSSEVGTVDEPDLTSHLIEVRPSGSQKTFGLLDPALEWIVARHAELGVDPAQITVKGASAGAGLCAALTLAVRERGGPAIAFQFLFHSQAR